MKLNIIKRKLFCLWGPLEEESHSKRSQTENNVWFETGLYEFWERASEAEFGKRRWRVSGITIEEA
jgi:hypothetical protein